MTLGDIQTRMLLAVLLPVTVLTVLLSGVFLFARVDDVNQAHRQSERSLARQIALASEYGFSSVDTGYLQSIALRASREPNVHTVAMLDTQGRILARAGRRSYTTFPVLTGQESSQFDSATDTDILVQPIIADQSKFETSWEAQGKGAGLKPQLLGHVLIEFAHDAVVWREREVLLVGLAVSLGLLLLGGFLAVRLGRGVISPVLRVSHLIERIGNGELSARAVLLPDDPLRNLQQGLNQMAERLESGRDELEQRIAVATQELREKKEEAETATLAKSRFLSAASHDLRQPTHALGMFVARLAQLPHDTETGHLIENLEASVLAMQDLLDGLLDISRLDARAVQVQAHPFAVADIFEKLRAELTSAAAEKGLRLRIRPSNVWLMSDPTLLHRILLNLVSNAVRYTPKGSVLVACRVGGDGRHVRLEVWDSGIGIAPEHQQSIFMEFYQVGNTERDRDKGLGLGLNIVERTLRLLGHPLQLRSSPGRGTRFSMQVPRVAPGAEMDQRNPLRVKTSDDLVGLLVLVIEDDALAREGLVSLLESWGCVVRACEGLSMALRQLEQGPVPDVIVSDYRLRDGENGLETIRQLRAAAAGRQIPACLMSGDTDPNLIQVARDASLTLLHKPVRPAKLRSLIRRLAVDHSASVQDAVPPADFHI